jgi:CHAT domain-containing protein
MINPKYKYLLQFLIFIVAFALLNTNGCRKISDDSAGKETLDSLGIVQINTTVNDLINTGFSFEDKAIYDSALIYYRKALPLSLRINDSITVSDIYENIGFVYREKAQYDSSLNYHQKSLDLRRTIGDKNKLSRSYNNIGEIYQLLNQYALSNNYLDSCISILSTEENLGNPITTKGLNCCLLGQYEKAISYHSNALKLFNKYSDSSKLTFVYINLGNDYYYLKDFQKALYYYRNALSISRKLNIPLNIGIIQGHISLLLNEQKKYNQALVYADSALKSAIENRSKLDQGASYYKLGIISLNRDSKNDAIKYFNQALLLFRQCNTKEREGMVYYRLMLAWKKLNNSNLAIFYGKLAVNILQEIRKSIKSLNYDDQRDYLKSKESIYRDLISLLIDEGRLGESQQVIGMLKDDEFFDYIRGGNSNLSSLNTRADYTKTETKWEQRYSEIVDSILYFYKEYESLCSKSNRTEQENVRLQKTEKDLETTMRAYDKVVEGLEKEFSYSSEKLGEVDIVKNPESVFYHLGKYGTGSVAIYTFISKNTYYMIFIAPPNVRIAKQTKINPRNLNRDVAEFREALQNPTQDPIRFAQNLYKILLGPIEKELDIYKPKNIIWSLDGVLRYLPVSALHDGKHYLVEKYRNIIFIPRNISWIYLVKKSDCKALGMGVSRAIGEFDSLPSVPDELYGIIKRKGSDSNVGIFNGVIKLNNEFTQNSMMDELQKAYPIVHIASHFQLNPGDNSRSFLLLGDGNKLSMDEFKYKLLIFSEVMLLSLSACNTGVGTLAGGKEIEDFASLAQEQGAKAVLATLWSVPDKSTSELMKTFYRLREENKAKTFGESLQKVQLAL